MTETDSLNPPFPAGRMAGWLALVAGVGAGLAAAIVHYQFQRPDQAILAAITSAGCLLGSLVALELIRRAARVSLQRVVSVCVGGMTVRLGISVAVALLIVNVFDYATRAVVLWTMGWYILLLIVEVRLLAGYFQQVQGHKPAKGSPIVEGTSS